VTDRLPGSPVDPSSKVEEPRADIQSHLLLKTIATAVSVAIGDASERAVSVLGLGGNTSSTTVPFSW
jgi:hypothetical protein